jgi:hypothetical protein
MTDVVVKSWENLSLVDTGLNPNRGVRFVMPDPSWIALCFRKGDGVLSVSSSSTLCIELVSGNTARLRTTP